ncbi:MAG: HlyD family secretion protein [Cyanobacteriota bacterium]|jgi:multidrug resistance efflux pump
MPAERNQTNTSRVSSSDKSRPSPQSVQPQTGLLLPKLELDDYVPSIRPWLQVSTLALLATSGLALLFLAICPYRVVVRGTGSVRPAAGEVLVNAPVEGRVISIDVAVNQSVVAGQVIVTLDRSRQTGALEEAEKNKAALLQQLRALRSQTAAEFAGAQLEVEKMRSELNYAQTEFNRYQSLQSEGAVSASIVDQRRAVMNKAKAGLGQASEALAALRSEAVNKEAVLIKEIAAVERAASEGYRSLSATKVLSPIKGIILQLKVQNPQQTIALGQELAVITPSSAERIVKVKIRGSDVEQVQPGQHADLRLQGCPYPDFGTLAATVIAVSPDVLPTNSLQQTSPEITADFGQYEITLKPASNQLKANGMHCDLKLGMRLDADISTRSETILRFILRKTRLFVNV